MIGIGRRVYGAGAIALGMVVLAWGAFPEVWLPVPAHFPAYLILAYASAAWLLAAGVAINVQRTAAIAALALALLFAGSMLIVLAPHTLAKPAEWGGWQGIAESLAMALGGLLAYTLAPGAGASRAAGLARGAWLAFGACLLVFGTSHFLYAQFTASLVPAWLPPSRLFWAYATGAAQIAAGLAMLTGVKARLAAILLTIMYAAFGLLVHIPSIIADPSSLTNWAENGINLLLVGAAWNLADSLSVKRSWRLLEWFSVRRNHLTPERTANQGAGLGLRSKRSEKRV